MKGQTYLGSYPQFMGMDFLALKPVMGQGIMTERHWRTTDHPSQSGQAAYKWQWAWTGVVPKSETPDPTSPTMFSLQNFVSMRSKLSPSMY